MARPKKAAPQWPVGGEPKAAPVVPIVLSLADAVAAIGRKFQEPPTRGKADSSVEVLSGGARFGADFPALYLNEALAAEAWYAAMDKATTHLVDGDRLVWVEPPSLMHLQITIMDMRDRTHRVGNDRYVARSKHAVVKAEAKDEAA